MIYTKLYKPPESLYIKFEDDIKDLVIDEYNEVFKIYTFNESDTVFLLGNKNVLFNFHLIESLMKSNSINCTIIDKYYMEYFINVNFLWDKISIYMDLEEWFIKKYYNCINYSNIEKYQYSTEVLEYIFSQLDYHYGKEKKKMVMLLINFNIFIL